jgi:hypothetical protein
MDNLASGFKSDLMRKPDDGHFHFNKRPFMHSALVLLIKQVAGVSIAALSVVVFVAFVSIPYTLNGHPGEARASDAFIQHMT